MSRQEFSKAVRRDAFCRADGRCENPECRKKLAYGEAEYHHVQEAFLFGVPLIENCLVLCRKCHTEITKSRRPEIDKTRRIADKRMGIKRKSTMPGSRSSKWRKRMDGTVELR